MKTIYMSKKLKYSISIAVLFWLFIQLVSAAGPLEKKDYERVISESFSIDSDGEVRITNKYGQINVDTWDKNEVDIVVTITVDAGSQSKADDLLDLITINMTNGDDFVQAITEIKEAKKSWWNWGSSNNNKYEINYEVRMPASCDVTIANKYGAVIIDDIHGDCELDVKYGNFTVGSVGGDFEFELGYGNGQLTTGQDVEGSIKYGNLTMEQVRDVDLHSRYSKVTIDKANHVSSESKYDGFDLGELLTLRNEGKYDHFDVESVQEISIETKYTDVKIRRLDKAGDFDMSYGGVKIMEVSSSLNKIYGEGKYTSFKIDVDKLESSYFNLNVSYGTIYLPSNIKLEVSETKNNKSGFFGSENTETKLEISTSYGNIKLYN